MKKITYSDSISTGLAVFSMLFGAGNLMYPIEVGMRSGQYGFLGIAGFTITAVLLPIIGLIGMILFNGNYNAYFERLGSKIGQLVLGICFITIGPLIAIPRIVTLSHTMIGPFIPLSYIDGVSMSSAFLFALLFLGLTYLATFRENSIVTILGCFISPLLLGSLSIIIVRGIMSSEVTTHTDLAPATVLYNSLIAGYETLDLLGALFFSSIILQLLKNTYGFAIENNKNLLIQMSIRAGVIGTVLLGIVYIGMGILGMYHGHGLEAVHPDILFRVISYNVTNQYGAALIGTAVLMACLSTAIALSAVVAEYTQNTIFRKKISFPTALALVLMSSIPLSVAGLGAVRHIAGGPLLYVGYPVLITLTICNILYKTVGFKPVKMPVLITLVITSVAYLYQ